MWQNAKNIYHLFVAVLANTWFRFPSRKLIVIGVTGTDGKTTTVNLIYHILKTAGKNVSMVSTVGAHIHEKIMPLNFHVTTPSPIQLQKFLSFAAKKKTPENYVVLEVSSHSIDQSRIWGIPFDIGIVTNVTNEHLDYHKTYERYLHTKMRLLQLAKTAIVNVDDRSYQTIKEHIPGGKTITYGIYKPAQITPDSYKFSSSLIGEFNTYNILAAFAACKKLGIDEQRIRKGIKTFSTPNGRMNEIPNKKGLTIIVDYAHTPNGLEQALMAITKQKRKTGRIIALVGAEGKRDPGKREKIGEVAAKYANTVIITAVDPRGEANRINAQILKGTEKFGKVLNKSVFVEPDRRKAIEFALNNLGKSGDVIALFGKGHERSMNYDGLHEISWNDSEEVKKILE